MYYNYFYNISYRFIIHYALSHLESLLKIKAGLLTDMLKDDQMLFYMWITDFALQRNSLSQPYTVLVQQIHTRMDTKK